MSLSSGTRRGPYEVAAPLGAGGMGEVYRARDTRLDRDVAIKVLPAEVAGDAERLARFRREAHVLASLNHPNIAAIYGRGERQAVPRPRAGRGRHTTGAHRPREDPAGRRPPGRTPDRRSAGGSPRARHRASGPEAGEREADARGQGEGAGLRPGEGVLGRRRHGPIRPLARELACDKGQLGTVRMLQERYGEALAARQEARHTFEQLGESGAGGD